MERGIMTGMNQPPHKQSSQPSLKSLPAEPQENNSLSGRPPTTPGHHCRCSRASRGMSGTSSQGGSRLIPPDRWRHCIGRCMRRHPTLAEGKGWSQARLEPQTLWSPRGYSGQMRWYSPAVSTPSLWGDESGFVYQWIFVCVSWRVGYHQTPHVRAFARIDGRCWGVCLEVC